VSPLVSQAMRLGESSLDPSSSFVGKKKKKKKPRRPDAGGLLHVPGRWDRGRLGRKKKKKEGNNLGGRSAAPPELHEKRMEDFPPASVQYICASCSTILLGGSGKREGDIRPLAWLRTA